MKQEYRFVFTCEALFNCVLLMFMPLFELRPNTNLHCSSPISGLIMFLSLAIISLSSNFVTWLIRLFCAMTFIMNRSFFRGWGGEGGGDLCYKLLILKYRPKVLVLPKRWALKQKSLSNTWPSSRQTYENKNFIYHKFWKYCTSNNWPSINMYFSKYRPEILELISRRTF